MDKSLVNLPDHADDQVILYIYIYKLLNHFCTSSKLTMISAETGSRLTLEEIKTEKDLSVYFSSDLKLRTHCQHSAAKANSILGQLRQAFHAWNPQSFNSLYTAFVRPHLEYASSVWNPHRRADVRIIENIQRRATKLVDQGVTSSPTTRSQMDYLTSTGYPQPNSCRPSPATAQPTQSGITKNAFLSNYPTARREQTSNNRVASTWNNLASSTVNAPTLNSFKARTNTTTT
ncbi:RNA-directed DNA polymerase from mobile element jockey-like [Brachionus plicatilis]|uniref:RNA-directed DNA polymerase from mobile element jockey-like n=1 Tax=Brachionus plicatilis TaxID=10195 RepID=A0A3M7QPJ9_BRAPC|nr:RNA-directed DNA polymerase from mobile element jockey-like [Brachionus plicatilis]